jgi:hypothetical protein
MGSSISAVAGYAAAPVLAVMKQIGISGNGKHFDAAFLTKAFTDAGYARNSDGSFQINQMAVTVNNDGSLSMKLEIPNFGEWTIDIADANEDGEYEVTDNNLSTHGRISTAQENAFEQEFSNIMENNNVYCHKKKKGGSSGGASSGSDNWFIQMAESLGEMLNQMANDVKTATDNVKTKNGQAPFKDSMRVQGLAQQLSFMSQAFMTTLNSIGEAIKTAVTAGGAAR